MMDDIPEALRDKTKRRQVWRRRTEFILILGGCLGVGVISLLIAIFWFRPSPQSQVISSTTPSPEATSKPNSTPEEAENILGHLPYAEASTKELKAVTPDNQIRLKKVAAEQFLEMQAAAKAKGIILTPISGFRSVSEQEYLFFKVKEQRNQETTKRAEVSAPPGYSEHHTGYAIDIGDGRTPATNLSPSFEKTAAFQWLKDNANKYSFEMSFPKDNPQRVNYEPWHWRFVGDRQSLETFYKSRNFQQEFKQNPEFNR